MSFASDSKRVRSRMKSLERTLEAKRAVLVASHNNPDPDSIVSSLLLGALLERVFGLRVTTAFNGVIGRAENKALLEYTDLRLTPLRGIDVAAFEVVALVDAQPGSGNHPFDEHGKTAIVLDHHRLRHETRHVAFFDVREHLATTTTLLYLYWRAWKLELDVRYATAMLYALRSETADMGREASVVDIRLFKDLYALADLPALSRIINAKVGESYFAAIHDAIARSEVYGPLVVSRMATLPYPDAVAQIAEYFLRIEGVSTSCCIGRFGDEILFSLRSDNPAAHLGALARRIAGGLGTAGGHGASAGGQVPLESDDLQRVRRIEDRIIGRLIDELGLASAPRRSLIRDLPSAGS